MGPELIITVGPLGVVIPSEALFIAADHARRIDPTLAARYQRLMVTAGKHHNSPLRHVATTLLTRIVACWRPGERYVIRDCEGRPVSADEGRSIVAERYSVPAEVRRQHIGPRTGRKQADGPPQSGVAERPGGPPDLDPVPLSPLVDHAPTHDLDGHDDGSRVEGLRDSCGQRVRGARRALP